LLIIFRIRNLISSLFFNHTTLLSNLIKLQSSKTVSNNLWTKTGALGKQDLPHHSTQKPTVTPLKKRDNRGNTHHRKKRSNSTTKNKFSDAS
jgi:hypothetical protein